MMAPRQVNLNMRFDYGMHTALSFLTLVLLSALGTVAAGQDRRDWQSVAQLRAGDRIRLSLKTGPVEGAFQNWTAQQVTAGTVTARREDVFKIERYRQSGWGRGKRAAVGALIGFGGGFAVGAGVGGCRGGQLGPASPAESGVRWSEAWAR
jgi:hypothetical protein